MIAYDRAVTRRAWQRFHLKISSVWPGCYNGQVKKLLLILLLTILPIQYSWSMAAVYCQHERSTSTHFGHHGHQHQAQAGDEDGAKDKLSKHGDCEVCHHAVQASLPGADALLVKAPAVGYAPPGALHYHSYIADGPPRPNWSFAA
jgi:hypothetical protein